MHSFVDQMFFVAYIICHAHSLQKKPPKEAKEAKKKDPNAPKGRSSAYNYYSSAKRSDVKAANPDAQHALVMRRHVFETANVMGLPFDRSEKPLLVLGNRAGRTDFLTAATPRAELFDIPVAWPIQRQIRINQDPNHLGPCADLGKDTNTVG